MKFYSRILGDRDYSLFETRHFGLRLPGTLSSFGDVRNASVSNWAGVKRASELAKTKLGERATNKSALELFASRSVLKRPASILVEDLQDISFYCFWRLYDVNKGALVRKQKEKMLAITGNGWSSHAKRNHDKHEDFARKTLYAYMPCAKLSGCEYVDYVVDRFYNKSYAAAMQDFVRSEGNLWCPKWIKRNYEILNKDAGVVRENESNNGKTERVGEPKEFDSKDDGAINGPSDSNKFPHAEQFKADFCFEPAGEPTVEEDTERVEAHGTDYIRHETNRPAWQLHSELGPNVDADARHAKDAAAPFEEIVNPVEPMLAYDRHWSNFDLTRVIKTWEEIRNTTATYSDESLCAETLGDDYQLLFVTMVLDHVRYIMECVAKHEQPEPLRLLLLGTAGTGKTRAVRTALQEIQCALQAANLHADVVEEGFVRVGAPTGTAAFNLRFNATTIHRLIKWTTPPNFAPAKGDALIALQQHLKETRLIVLDEISMVGRQMMGRIDSRLQQGRAGKNDDGHSLGGASCVGVGDPAQCEAIFEQQIYDVRPHHGTVDDGQRQPVLLSNNGLAIYSEFDKVIVLTTTHRLTKVDNPKTDEERAFNERADQFVKMLQQLRDLKWTAKDYYWLCKRKRSQLTMQERAEFTEAPVIMDFRRATDNNPEDNCEFYNKGYLRNMARTKNVPVIRFDALHEGVSQIEGLKIGEEAFQGLASTLEIAENARVILFHNLAVQHGLMNGTQGQIEQIVYETGNQPRMNIFLNVSQEQS